MTPTTARTLVQVEGLLLAAMVAVMADQTAAQPVLTRPEAVRALADQRTALRYLPRPRLDNN